MRDKVEELLIQFENEFKQNPQLRIEDQIVDPALLADLSEGDVQKLFRELILLEVDLRFGDDQFIDTVDYKRRFPEYETIVDQAVERIQNLTAPDVSEIDGVEETLNFQGSREEQVFTLEGEASIPSVLGKFREINVIGRGGFGIVCRARDSESGELRALKFPKVHSGNRSSMIELLKKETEKSLQLEHPHVVKTYGFEIIDGYVFVVQQFVDGSDLKATMKKERTLVQKLELVAKIADALQAAHQQLHLFHCDLKPANILMGPNDHPLVADFGLAFMESEQLDMPNQQCGTPAYMSPQLVRGLVRDIDGRTDIFSLGVILYELLTERKPFRGHTRSELFRQIEEKDPSSPKAYNDDVDDELERIVFKSLAKPARERYSTAKDLSDDLRYWIGQLAEKQKAIVEPQAEAVFIPKGLRSYGAEDSGFFLDLLPGPRVRGSFPVSIQFWTQRICEPVTHTERVPVGFLFGPSGSGKSSFIKAGLLPQLDDSIITIYVEATTGDTEVRILKALRSKFDQIPFDQALPDIFAGLAKGKWRARESRNNKILLVIDQFEQRLSQNDNYANSQLAVALQHCDGERLQSILLCRDDFWLAAGRFADALEVDIREAENSQSIDLFDRSHAQKVLIKLGRAYHQLPDSDADFTEDQLEFFEHALDQLAQDNYVICVRLTLFAEMFKNRPWTIDELKRVGGVAGVGQQFLESNFGKESLNTRFRSQREMVQLILEKLLPESGRDIRGAMKSRQELLEAAGGEDRSAAFESATRVLDDELRLITRTDPDSSEANSQGARTDQSDKGFYQLTHDYLVPSIRAWLNTELRNNRRGRAVIRLRELASQVVPGQPPRYLPSNFEWLYWRFSIADQVRTENEKKVYAGGRSNFLKSAIWSTAAALVLVSVLLFVNWRQQKWNHARQLVDNLLSFDIIHLPSILGEMKQDRRLVKMALAGKETPAEDPIDRVAIADAYLDEEYQDLLELLLLAPERSPRELEALIRVIQQSSQDGKYVEYLKEQIEDETTSSLSRFRAIAGIAQLSSRDSALTRWAPAVVRSLVGEPETWRNHWIDLLEPIGSDLSTESIELFRSVSDPLNCRTLANAIIAFTEQDQLPGVFADLLETANDDQFAALLETVEKKGLVDPLMAHLNSVKSTLESPQAIAAVAAAMLHFGNEDELIARLSEAKSTSAQPYLVAATNPKRIQFDSLKSVWTRIKSSQNQDLRFRILLCLAEQCPELDPKIDQENIDWLSTEVVAMHRNELDGGCFAVEELIIKRLTSKTDIPSLDELRQKRLEASRNGVLGQVYLSKQRIPFRIFRTEETGLDYSFAVTMHEVSEKQYALFDVQSKRRGQAPQILTGLGQALDFCNWLSDENELEKVYSEEDKEPGKLQFDTDKSGFRLMLVSEWMPISLDRKAMLDYGDKYIFANQYMWTRFNARVGNDLGPQPVATLLPNRFGLFDIYGNATELTIKKIKKDDKETYRFVAPGGNVYTQPDTVGLNFQPVTTMLYQFLFGFRVVRIMS